MIILMGMPGSGKSTQAALLSRYLQCPSLSTGELLRQQHNFEHDKTMASGQLINDETMFDLVRNKLQELHWESKEVILEGFPRNIAQAEWLGSQEKTGHTFITSVIHIRMPKDKVIARLLARGRPDDNETAIIRRFEEYESRALPILSYFSDQNYPVNEIDGTGGIDEVHKSIVESLKINLR